MRHLPRLKRPMDFMGEYMWRLKPVHIGYARPTGMPMKGSLIDQAAAIREVFPDIPVVTDGEVIRPHKKAKKGFISVIYPAKMLEFRPNLLDLIARKWGGERIVLVVKSAEILEPYLSDIMFALNYNIFPIDTFGRLPGTPLPAALAKFTS